MTNKNNVQQYLQLENINHLNDFLCLLPQLSDYKNNDFRDTNRKLIHNVDRQEADDHSYARSHIRTEVNSLSNADANSYSKSIAIGIDNSGKITTGGGNDIIFGVANADASSEAKAIALAKSLFNCASTADANSQSIARSLALATGINNLGRIATGGGNDIIFGVANADASSEAKAIALAKLFSDNTSAADANSESIAEAIAGGAGIVNSGTIATGRGSDVIVGIANISTSTQALARAKAIVKANGFDNMSDLIDAQSTSNAIANAQTQAFGIYNSGKIFSGHGSDLILGLANTENSSNTEAFAKTNAISDIATATAEGAANAGISGNAIGIVNSGKINTGKGYDTIIGLAINNSLATANADAKAISAGNDNDSKSNTNAVSDTSAAIAIGIDNSSGKICTGKGNDLIIGNASTIGILGGEIKTGSGRDRIIGKGGSVGILDSKIYTGAGDDYLQAVKIEIDPVTRDSIVSEDQTGAISNTEVYGHSGHDVFEIGGFAGSVLVNGGRDFDVLQLWGKIDDYQITLSSDCRTLTIEDSGSTLTAKNVEEFHFDDSQYSIKDFA